MVVFTSPIPNARAGGLADNLNRTSCAPPYITQLGGSFSVRCGTSFRTFKHPRPSIPNVDVAVVVSLGPTQRPSITVFKRKTPSPIRSEFCSRAKIPSRLSNHSMGSRFPDQDGFVQAPIIKKRMCFSRNWLHKNELGRNPKPRWHSPPLQLTACRCSSLSSLSNQQTPGIPRAIGHKIMRDFFLDGPSRKINKTLNLLHIDAHRGSKISQAHKAE